MNYSFKNKIKHAYSRHYHACLTPSEILEIQKLGAIITPFFVKHANDLKSKGISRSIDISFDLPDNSKLYKIIKQKS